MHRSPLLTAGGLVEVHIDALQLQVGVAVVCAGGVHTVLIGHDLQERGGGRRGSIAAWAALT